jgi:hypothetical protein
VITPDQVLRTVKLGQDFGKFFLGAETEVAKVVHEIGWPYPLVPETDHRLVHIVNASERPGTVVDDVLVEVMRVRGIEGGHVFGFLGSRLQVCVKNSTEPLQIISVVTTGRATSNLWHFLQRAHLGFLRKAQRLRPQLVEHCGRAQHRGANVGCVLRQAFQVIAMQLHTALMGLDQAINTGPKFLLCLGKLGNDNGVVEEAWF